MTLATGSRLGSYEILSALGAGGMGEVYRATDTVLKRQVALKVLPPDVAADPERIARFQREAEVLAALNHPHIAAIYGLEKADGVTALVLELVEGPTLADRIEQGPIPIDEALPIARQIAEALEAAHEQGIIHRDLKPANIKVRDDGTVKVLDFGLAKALEPASGGSPASIANSPTITSPAMMTGIGVILGTAAYMSPEQAKGRPADKRSDVWAFGAVLYEMVTGHRAFKGEDIADTMAAVLKEDPDWSLLPANLSPAVRAVIQGCLRKDRKARIGDISTPRFLLSEPQVAPTAIPVAHAATWRLTTLALALLIACTATAWALWARDAPAARTVTRFEITLPAGQQLFPSRRPLAISPDGTRIVYSAAGGLYLRTLWELEAKPIPGGENGVNPVFSPDGQWVAFSWGGWIRRIAIGGGTPVPVCEVGSTAGMTWDARGILFAQFGSGILRVAATGGKPEVLVSVTDPEDFALSPQLLPDGDTVLFTMAKRVPSAIDRWNEAKVVVQSLKTGRRTTLVEGGGDAWYSPTGHLVYASEGSVFAVPFDARTLALTGSAASIIRGVRRETLTSGMASFAFSDSGSLVYAPGPPLPGQQVLALFDRKGGAQPLDVPPGRYNYPRVSPDGSRVAFETTDGKQNAIAIFNLSGTSGPRRLTFGGNNRFPVWSNDSERVAFQSDRDGDAAVFWQPADGTAAERLTRPAGGASHIPESWDPKGKVLLFSEAKDSVSSLWALSLADRKAVPFSDVKNSAAPTDAAFSPDGRWVAYQTMQAGMSEGTTYVEPFPPTGAQHQIGTGGRPVWSRGGTELLFLPSPGRMMAAAVRTVPEFSFTNPVVETRDFLTAGPLTPRTHDVMPDGRLIGVGTAGQILNPSSAGKIHVVQNWFEELKRLVPVD